MSSPSSRDPYDANLFALFSANSHSLIPVNLKTPITKKKNTLA